MDLSKRELERKLQINKEFYDEEILKYATKYEIVRKEAAIEIEDSLRKLRQEIKNLGAENSNFSQEMEEGNRHANKIQAELNEYKQKYLILK